MDDIQSKYTVKVTPKPDKSLVTSACSTIVKPILTPDYACDRCDDVAKPCWLTCSIGLKKQKAFVDEAFSSWGKSNTV